MAPKLSDVSLNFALRLELPGLLENIPACGVGEAVAKICPPLCDGLKSSCEDSAFR